MTVARSLGRSGALAVSLFLFSAHLSAAPAVAAQGDCGQPQSDGATPTATDALAALNAAVGLLACELCVCDVDGSGAIAATDALSILSLAVGGSVSLDCPSCSATTTTTTPITTSTTTTTTTSTTTTTVPGFPALTAGDFPAVSPCSDRDTPGNDPDAIAAITAATGIVWVTNETQRDTQGYPEICGLTSVDNTLPPGAIEWDPAQNAFRRSNFFTTFITDYFRFAQTGGTADLCQTGNDGMTDAMPRAGIYRKDFCIEGAGNAYDARVRMTVSGPSADQTLASLGVTRFDLLTCDGTSEIVTRADGIAMLEADPTDIDFTVKSGSCDGGTTHLTVESSVICVKKRTGPCLP
jgi:hypothetical protein